MMVLELVDELEISSVDFINVENPEEHYSPPAVPPKTSAAMKGNPALRHRSQATSLARRLPHPGSLAGIAGILLASGLVVGAGYFGYRRLFARGRFGR